MQSEYTHHKAYSSKTYVRKPDAIYVDVHGCRWMARDAGGWPEMQVDVQGWRWIARYKHAPEFATLSLPIVWHLAEHRCAL